MNTQAEVVLAILLIVINIPFTVAEWRVILCGMHIYQGFKSWLPMSTLCIIRAVLLVANVWCLWSALYPYRWIAIIILHSSLMVFAGVIVIFGPSIFGRDDDDED